MATRKQRLWHVSHLDFNDFVHVLVDECERDGRFIYFWSQHEEALIKGLLVQNFTLDSINTAQTRSNSRDASRISAISKSK